MKHMLKGAGGPRYCGATEGVDASPSDQYVYMSGFDKKSPDICEACKIASLRAITIPAGALKAVRTMTHPSPPSRETLKKYGLDLIKWVSIVQSQGGVCAICKKLPKSGRLHIDHEHVKGWKKMRPEARASYVRGLLCWYCNFNHMGRNMTLDKAENMVKYMENYATI